MPEAAGAARQVRGTPSPTPPFLLNLFAVPPGAEQGTFSLQSLGTSCQTFDLGRGSALCSLPCGGILGSVGSGDSGGGVNRQGGVPALTLKQICFQGTTPSPFFSSLGSPELWRFTGLSVHAKFCVLPQMHAVSMV